MALIINPIERSKPQIGYMRVSKADGSQGTDLQRDALIAAAIDPAQLYADQASGQRKDRPGLAAGLKALRAGDTRVVWKLDRLGRDLRHLTASGSLASSPRWLSSRGR